MQSHENQWIDISVLIRHGMPLWPGDPDIGLETAEKTVYRVTSLRMSAHTGTHCDAPRHFFASGASIDAFPPEAGIGTARVIQTDGPVTEAALGQMGERLLFKGAPYIEPAAARAIAAAGVRLVGIDSLSVDPVESTEYAAHKILLGSGVWIVELLDLSAAMPGRYELICLPLKICGSDGAPARAFLRRLAE